MTDPAMREREQVIAFLDALALGCGSEQAATLNYAATCIHLRFHHTWGEYEEMLQMRDTHP